MSIRVMSAVWEFSTAEGTDLLVLLALADIARDDGVAWPAVATVARKARITERGAQKSMRRLEETGELHVIARAGRGHTNTYIIRLKGVPPDTITAPEKVNSRVAKGEPQGLNGEPQGLNGERSFARPVINRQDPLRNRARSPRNGERGGTLTRDQWAADAERWNAEH